MSKQFLLHLEVAPLRDWIEGFDTNGDPLPGIGWNPAMRYSVEIVMKMYHYIDRHRRKDGPSAYEILLTLCPDKTDEVEKILQDHVTARLLGCDVKHKEFISDDSDDF